MNNGAELLQIGWREWGQLPLLGVERIKIKTDTGAKTSCLHAVDIEQFEQDGRAWVAFSTQLAQGDNAPLHRCRAPMADVRQIKSSTGTTQARPIIRTPLTLGEQQWEIDLSLTDRSNMKFRMLLGRHAMRGRYMINPGASFLASPPYTP